MGKSYAIEQKCKQWRQQRFAYNRDCQIFNALTVEWALRALIDFTLSNARRFYSSMGNPLAGKGLSKATNEAPRSYDKNDNNRDNNNKNNIYNIIM